MALKDELGNFCWFTLMTTDVGKANHFYQQLFNYELSELEIPGMGTSTIYSAAGQAFANPAQLEAGEEVPSHWINYITVADVDESCKQAEALGGKVCIPAFDLPSIGRTALVNDPSGAVFHLFTPENKDTDEDVSEEPTEGDTPEGEGEAEADEAEGETATL